MLKQLRSTRTFLRWAMGLALVLFAGCSNSATPYVPELVPVAGTITYKGQPVRGAIVAFHPAESADVTEAAWAETDSQGRFSLLMQDYGPGAMPGDYVVTVKHSTDNLPDKYETQDSTPLRATVEDKEQNEIPLVLED